MIRRLASTFALNAAVLLFWSVSIQAAEPPPAAPAPGSAATYVGHAGLEAQMAAALAASKDPAVASVVSTDQYVIASVRRGKPTAPPAIHPGWTEVHLILDGGGTFVTGGKIVTPPGTTLAVIEGGVSQKVTKGDVVIVPANSPHWYQQLDRNFKAIEVRFIAPVPAAK